MIERRKLSFLTLVPWNVWRSPCPQLNILSYVFKIFLVYWFERERKGVGREGKRERERERERDFLFHLFMHSLVYSWSGIEPTILVYQDDALTNWATQPGPVLPVFLLLHLVECLLCARYYVRLRTQWWQARPCLWRAYGLCFLSLKSTLILTPLPVGLLLFAKHSDKWEAVEREGNRKRGKEK